jgi:hypothetical protein
MASNELASVREVIISAEGVREEWEEFLFVNVIAVILKDKHWLNLPAHKDQSYQQLYKVKSTRS